jgi:selenocysteine-specific elongation factor
MVHVGAARTAARVRVLAGEIVRLMLRDPLPLHVGDRLLLRVPGAARPQQPRPVRSRAAQPWPALTGAVVLDVAAPVLVGRGAAASAGAELGSWPALPGAEHLLRRHGLLRLPALRAMGVTRAPAPVAGDWIADPARWAVLRQRLPAVVSAHAARDPLAPGMPLEAARAALGVPDRRLVEAMAAPAFSVADGVLRLAGAARTPGTLPAGARPAGIQPAGTHQTGTLPAGTHRTGALPAGTLPERLLAAVRELLADLSKAPFAAPEAGRLRELGLDSRALATAARAGLLLRVSDQIVLAPKADAAAAGVLAALPQPFTTAEARRALGTTRRVAIPLLEFLDRAGITQRLPDDRRTVRTSRS